MQVIKLSTGIEGDENYLPATVDGGLGVYVTSVEAAVIVNNPTAANLCVDASGANVPVVNASATTLAVSAGATTPVAVRVSNGAAFVDTIPVSIAGTVTVAGTVAVSGTVAATQSGAWNIGTVTTITNTVTVAGTVALSGTSAVSGTVTANQGTAAAIANAWPIKVTDGTNFANITTLSGPVYALKVDVVKQVGGGYSQVDRSAYTDGASPTEVVGGVFNDSATAPGAGQAGYARITSFRAFHVNLRRNADGAELGITATPLRVDPVGTTTQPVSGTVTANQGATAWVDNITQINTVSITAAAAGCLPVQNVPSGGGGGATQTPWRAHAILSASQTSQAIHTPASGKTAFIEGIQVILSAGAGILYIYDGTSSAANRLWASTVTWGYLNQIYTPSRPIPLSAINNVLRYDTGASVVGDILAWGYDA
jgi:hypothetical protein